MIDGSKKIDYRKTKIPCRYTNAKQTKTLHNTYVMYVRNFKSEL